MWSGFVHALVFTQVLYWSGSGGLFLLFALSLVLCINVTWLALISLCSIKAHI